MLSRILTAIGALHDPPQSINGRPTTELSAPPQRINGDPMADPSFSGKPKPELSDPPQSINGDPAAELFEEEWVGTHIAFPVGDSDRTKLGEVLPDRPVTMLFSSSNDEDEDEIRISGNTGCNSYSLPLNSLSSNVIETSNDMITTLMYCAEEGAMDQEYSFSSLFSDEEIVYEIDGDVLSLWVALFDCEHADAFRECVAYKGEELGRFVKASSIVAFNEEIMETEWEGSEIANSDGALAPVNGGKPGYIVFTEDGWLLGSSGCNSFSYPVNYLSNSTFEIVDESSGRWTRRGCFDEKVHQERAYRRIFSLSKEFKVKLYEDVLELIAFMPETRSEKVVVRFVREADF